MTQIQTIRQQVKLEKGELNTDSQDSLGAVHLLRKGKRVGGWFGKTLIFPYKDRWVVNV